MALPIMIMNACVSRKKGSSSFQVTKDHVWASPGGFDLTLDIYTPKGLKINAPVLIIFHGGGWLVNTNSVMHQMAEYVAEKGNYVVCNVNYRLLSDQDNSVTLNEIVEDAFGAVLWIKQHVGEYGGDSTRVAVTGDSAGGHLAALVVTHGDKLSDTGFHGKPLGFLPSYMPVSKSVEQLVEEDAMALQAAVISYGIFDLVDCCAQGFEEAANFFWEMGNVTPRSLFGGNINVADHPEYYEFVSPIYDVPEIGTKKLAPQMCIVGSDDDLTTPALVKNYVEKMRAAGQAVSYWVHEGRPHAFLDSGVNEELHVSFEKDAPPAIDKMLLFLDGILKL